jgi:Tol biopolymer transport system component
LLGFIRIGADYGHTDAFLFPSERSEMTGVSLRWARLVALPVLLGVPTLLQAQPAPKPDSAKGAAAKKDLPLVATRTARFQTSKATWMSLDVSPDGQNIVFDMLGDLYTLPIAGGTATRISSGNAFDTQPRYSPDGRRIVFVSDRSGGDNVWTISTDGKDTTQITKGNDQLILSPEWTPDGKYIVASRSGGPLGGAAKLWMWHVDGGSGIQLIREPATIKTLGAAFSADGKQIWFAARSGDWQYNAILPQYQLNVYDRETGERRVVSARYGSAFRPALSPDGKYLVYGTRQDAETGLRIRDLQSGDERWLAYPVQRDDQESRAPLDVLPGYSFMPDSKSIVVSYGGEIWRVPVDGTAPARVPFTINADVAVGPEVKFAWRVNDSATFTARQIRGAVPSPDGTKLAFTAVDRLYVMDWPNGTPRRLTTMNTGEQMPTWSPDSKSIAFSTFTDGQGGHVFTVRADGKTAPKQLTTQAAIYQEMAYDPTGRRIVATMLNARDLVVIGTGGGGVYDDRIIWVPADGSGGVNVIGPSNGRGALHFTRDTTRIFAFSFAKGLVSFRWDNTDEKAIVKVVGPVPPSANLPPAERGVRIWSREAMAHTDLDQELALEGAPQPQPANVIRMAPVGDQALAEVGNDVYVVTVPPVAGQVPTINVAMPANANFPARRLSEVAGEFSTWSADGRKVHFSLANAHFIYDLDRAKVVDDSLKADARVRAALSDSAKKVLATADSVKKAAGDSAKAGYKPKEQRVVVTVQRDRPTGTVVLRGGRALTMKGSEIIEDADIVVTDRRISAIGRRGSVPVPADARIIDVAGKTITPGFVDTHYHAQWLQTDVHTTQAWQYLTTLAYGTTTTRDPQTGSTDILTYTDRVESGGMIGPRIYSTGPGVFWAEPIRDLDHARTILKRYSQYYDTKTLKMYMTGNRQQRQWVIMAAKELGIMPTTEGGLDYKLDITHALDGYPGIEHALPIAPMFNDVVELFKASQTTNSPTLLVSYGGPWGENFFYTHEDIQTDAKLAKFMPSSWIDSKSRRLGLGTGPGPGGWFREDEYVFPRHAEFVRRMVEGGARVGVGSHGQLQGLGYQWEMWAMASGGITPHDMLRVATIYGAEAIGLAQDIGSLEVGKLADILVMDADPLVNIRNTNTLRYVMKGGRLYDAGSLNEVWPTARALPVQGWQNLDPIAPAAGIKASGGGR